MVNTGKPSQGCGTCRARRIKCDERKPTCFRCQKSRRECSGYRNQLFSRLGNVNGKLVKLSQVPSSSKKNYYQDEWSKSITKATRQPMSPPESIVLSPPENGISAALEEQALCHFIDNFVLLPCRGNSRSYMDFVIPAMVDEKSLMTPKSPLSAAVMAVAMALFGNRKKYQLVLGKAAKQYAKALQLINEALLDTERSLEDTTLATVLVLGLFEAFTGTCKPCIGWSSHCEGAAMLVKMRAQKKRATSLGHVLHVMTRSQLVVNCFVSSTQPPLGVGWWMQMGTRNGLPCQVAQLNLEIATLHAKANDVLAEAAANPVNTDSIIELQTMAQDLELKCKDWESSLEPEWTFSSVAWVDDVNPGHLISSPSFPGRVDEYQDISIGTAWCMMRANRIMLSAGIVRANAWLHPDDDYRITPEYNSTARISKYLIEGIIAAVPTFLGKIPDVLTRNCPPAIQTEALAGKSSLAFFIMWPLFIVTISDYTTDDQREWALGRLKYIAQEVGIHQATLFTQLNIRVPSMIIYKDRLAKEKGNTIAKVKILEMAIAKSSGIGKEAEHVLAGILGCK